MQPQPRLAPWLVGCSEKPKNRRIRLNQLPRPASGAFATGAKFAPANLWPRGYNRVRSSVSYCPFIWFWFMVLACCWFRFPSVFAKAFERIDGCTRRDTWRASAAAGNVQLSHRAVPSCDGWNNSGCLEMGRSLHPAFQNRFAPVASLFLG